MIIGSEKPVKSLKVSSCVTSLLLQKGIIWAWIGPNGFRKNHHGQIILNMLKRTSGEVKI